MSILKYFNNEPSSVLADPKWPLRMSDSVPLEAKDANLLLRSRVNLNKTGIICAPKNVSVMTEGHEQSQSHR